MNEFGVFLETLRGDMSLRDAADASGLSHTYIRDLELGVNRVTKTTIKPTPETLSKLARAYSFPYEELMFKAGYIQEEKIELKLGSRLRRARERRNLSQIDVFKKTGINNKTLSRYESGGTEPDVRSLTKLANLYEVSFDWLYGKHDEFMNEFNSLPESDQKMIRALVKRLIPNDG